MLKIAVIGSFSAAAALTFAPLAAADDLTSTLDTEVSALNDIFTVETDLAGDSSDVTTSGGYDIITPSDVTDVQGSGTTPFDYLVYGVDPTAAGLASDTGSYNVFNGALVEFADALNVEEYALENNGALIPSADATADLIGSSTTINDALATGTATDAAEYFLNYGLGDLSGFLDIPSL
jgi:hypothetical protein